MNVCKSPEHEPVNIVGTNTSGGSSGGGNPSSWLDDDSSMLDYYLIKLDECLPVSSPQTLNDESNIDMVSNTAAVLDDTTNTNSPSSDDSNTTFMVWQADITSKPSANTTPQSKSRSFLSNSAVASCSKPHCRLGCICPQTESSSSSSSSSSSPSLDETSKSSNGSHCGRYECMFECTCGPRRLRSSARTTTTTTTTTANNHVTTNVTTRSAANSNCCDGTYEIGQSRKREASVSSTNSIFSNSRFVLCIYMYMNEKYNETKQNKTKKRGM